MRLAGARSRGGGVRGARQGHVPWGGEGPARASSRSCAWLREVALSRGSLALSWRDAAASPAHSRRAPQCAGCPPSNWGRLPWTVLSHPCLGHHKEAGHSLFLLPPSGDPHVPQAPRPLALATVPGGTRGRTGVEDAGRVEQEGCVCFLSLNCVWHLCAHVCICIVLVRATLLSC